MMEGVVRKLPVKYENGSIDLVEIDGIFYLGRKKGTTEKRDVRSIYTFELDPCQLMAKNDISWFQKDTSWRKTTSHGSIGIPFR